MAGKTSRASTQPPGEALSPKHEAFVQAYVINGFNGAKAYREVYPNCKSAHAAEQAASRLLKNVEVAARIAEIMAVGAERAEVTAEEIILEEARLQLDKTTVDAIAEMSQQANGAMAGPLCGRCCGPCECSPIGSKW